MTSLGEFNRVGVSWYNAGMNWRTLVKTACLWIGCLTMVIGHAASFDVTIDNQTHHVITIYTQGQNATFSPPLAKVAVNESLGFHVETESQLITAAMRLVQPQISLVFSSERGTRVIGCSGFLSQYTCNLTTTPGGYYFTIEDRL